MTMEAIYVVGLVAVAAPGFAIVWVKIADMAHKSMQSTDETVATERSSGKVQ